VILWSAAITSVIGASYTSVTFLVGSSAGMERRRNVLVVGFIVASTLVFLFAGAAPVPLLIFAGAFNGLILPVGVAALLWAALRRADLMDGYGYPRGLALLGVAAWLITLYLGWQSFAKLGTLLAQA
jgi:Mn2+/Fe2+ NRAMP family transporter